MNDDTAAQLEALRQLSAALLRAGVDWWLFGGWALEFHAGRVTRDHADVELFSWKHDAAAVREALVGAGFVHPPGGLYPEECQSFLKDGQEIGAWFIERTEDGTIRTPGRWSDWPWIAGAFDEPPLTLAGITARAVSIDGLLDMKTRYADHPHGAPLRAKDIADIALLRAMRNRSGG
jgi:hypothetical protein